MKHYNLKLFLIFDKGTSEEFAQNLEKFLLEHFGNKYTLELVDVLENPDIANQFKVIATPTLIKTNPVPARRYVGFHENFEELLKLLDVVIEN